MLKETLKMSKCSEEEKKMYIYSKEVKNVKML